MTIERRETTKRLFRRNKTVITNLPQGYYEEIDKVPTYPGNKQSFLRTRDLHVVDDEMVSIYSHTSEKSPKEETPEYRRIKRDASERSYKDFIKTEINDAGIVINKRGKRVEIGWTPTVLSGDREIRAKALESMRDEGLITDADLKYCLDVFDHEQQVKRAEPKLG